MRHSHAQNYICHRASIAGQQAKSDQLWVVFTTIMVMHQPRGSWTAAECENPTPQHPLEGPERPCGKATRRDCTHTCSCAQVLGSCWDVAALTWLDGLLRRRQNMPGHHVSGTLKHPLRALGGHCPAPPGAARGTGRLCGGLIWCRRKTRDAPADGAAPPAAARNRSRVAPAQRSTRPGKDTTS
jgi:hypothetical protein